MRRTAGTIEDTDIQGYLLPMSTPATGLARIGRIDFYELASSFFRFGVQLGKEGRPRGICNAFRKTMVVGHAVHLQVLHADDPGQSHLKSGRLEGSQYVKEERKKKMEGITLQEHFATLEDPRVERTKHHQLLAIMTIALCAVICGAETWGVI